MPQTYFDEETFSLAIRDINTNPILTDRRLVRYLLKYPSDRRALLYNVRLLIILNRLDEAEAKLKRAKALIDSAKTPSESLEKSKESYIRARLMLLSFQKKYDEMYQFYNDNYKAIVAFNEQNPRQSLKPCYFWGQVNLGYIAQEIRESNSYEYRQIIKYSEDDFRKHLEESLVRTNNDKSAFAQGFPIDEVIQEVKYQISNADNRLNSGYYANKYVFRYPGCGICKEQTESGIKSQETDYFVVTTLHDTTSILSMTPASAKECENMPYIIDLSTFGMTPPSSPKVRQITGPGGRIDRFNKRFGLK